MKTLLTLLLGVVASGLAFVLFVPGVVVTLPPNEAPTSPKVLAVHAVLFALLNHTVLAVLKAVVRAL